MQGRREELGPLIYPDRAMLLPFLLRQLILVGIGAAPLLIVSYFPPLYIGREASVTCIMLLMIGIIVVCGSACMATMYRMFVPKPALIVSADGIYDACSYIFDGVGLIHWHEIRAVIPAEYPRSPVFSALLSREPFLVIVTQDWQAFMGRLSAAQRLLQVVMRFVIWSPRSSINLPEFMLGTPVAAAMTDVRQEYEQQRRSASAEHPIPIVSMPW
jgi:hypothetical protein